MTTWRVFAHEIEALSRADRLGLSYAQLQRGRPTVSALGTDAAGLTVSVQQADRAFAVFGTVPNDRTYLRLVRSQLLVASPGDDVEVLGERRSPSLTVTVDAHALQARVGTPVGITSCLEAPRRSVAALRASAELLLRHAGASEAQPAACERDAVLSRLASVMEAATPLRRRAAADEAASGVRAAVAFMRKQIAEALALDDLCRVCGWSRGALISHFRDAIGITPMLYFKLLKLNCIRRRLLDTHPEAGRVADIAAEFGIYHMGHFGADYRALFGERPSVTLARRLGGTPDAKTPRKHQRGAFCTRLDLRSSSPIISAKTASNFVSTAAHASG